MVLALLAAVQPHMISLMVAVAVDVVELLAHKREVADNYEGAVAEVDNYCCSTEVDNLD